MTAVHRSIACWTAGQHQEEEQERGRNLKQLKGKKGQVDGVCLV